MDSSDDSRSSSKRRRRNFTPDSFNSSEESSSSDEESITSRVSTTSQDVRILERHGLLSIRPWGTWKNHYEEFSSAAFPTTQQLAETATKLKNEKAEAQKKREEEAAAGESPVSGKSTDELPKDKNTNVTSGSSSGVKTEGTEAARIPGASATYVKYTTSFIKGIRPSTPAEIREAQMAKKSLAASMQSAPVEEPQEAKQPLKASSWGKPQEKKFPTNRQNSVAPPENEAQPSSWGKPQEKKIQSNNQNSGTPTAQSQEPAPETNVQKKKSNWVKAPEANNQDKQPTALQPPESTPNTVKPSGNEVLPKQSTSGNPPGNKDQPKESNSVGKEAGNEVPSNDPTSARPAARSSLREFHYTPYQNLVVQCPHNFAYRRFGTSIHRNRFQLQNSFARRWNPANLTFNRIRPRLNFDVNLRNRWNISLNEQRTRLVFPNFGLGRPVHHLIQRQNLRNHARHGVANRRSGSIFYRISMDCLLITIIALFAMLCWWLGMRERRNLGA